MIADDYGFGWTSAAGFIADFCAAGGDVVTQVFPPLGTTDYSSFVQQLPNPDEVDGYFWVVGGTGTKASLEAFVNAKGDLTGDQHAGNLFFSPALADGAGNGHRRRLRRRLRLTARRHHDTGDHGVSRQRGRSVGHPGRWYDAATSRRRRRQATGLRLRLRLLRGRHGTRAGAHRDTATVRQPRGAAGRARRSDARRAVRPRHARREPPRHHRHLRRSARRSTRRRARSSSRRSTSSRASTRPSAAPTPARRTRPNGTTHRARSGNCRGRAT